MSLVISPQHLASAASPEPAFDFSSAAPPAVRGEIEISLELRHAGLVQAKVRYELVGDRRLPVVMVAGGISAHRHVVPSEAFPEKGWASALAAPGRALDPQRRRLLAIDYVGADGHLDVPIDTADQADAIVQLLDALRIPQLEAFVGYSYGALAQAASTASSAQPVRSRMCIC